jgi:hypothetical protein
MTMSTSHITVDHDDSTGEVKVYVGGGDNTPARAIAEHIMRIASRIQGDNALPVETIEVN